MANIRDFLPGGSFVGQIVQLPTAAGDVVVNSDGSEFIRASYLAYPILAKHAPLIGAYPEMVSITRQVWTLPGGKVSRDAAWNGSVWCVITTAGDNKCYTSPDGEVWTERTMATAATWRGIAAKAGLFCVVGNGGACNTSPDGINWTNRTMATAANWDGIACNGSIFCACENSGSYVTNTSPDGVSWTAHATTQYFYGIVSNGTNFLVTSNLDYKAYLSSDGAAWNQQTMSGYLSGTKSKPVWVPSLGLYMVGSSANPNGFMSSPDGVTWTTRACAGAGGAVYCWDQVAAKVIVFSGATPQISPDAINFSTKYSNVTTPVAAAFNSTRSLVFDSSGGVHVVHLSTPDSGYFIPVGSAVGHIRTV